MSSISCLHILTIGHVLSDSLANLANCYKENNYCTSPELVRIKTVKSSGPISRIYAFVNLLCNGSDLVYD